MYIRHSRAPERVSAARCALACTLASLFLAACCQCKPLSIPVGGAFQLQDATAGAIMASLFELGLAEVNNQTALLPTLRLDARIADQGGDNNQATASAMQLAAQGCLFVVGLRTSKAAEPMSYVLNSFAIVHTSISASAPAFSNKKDYPFYSRMVPSDALQGQALARLAFSYGWRRCAIASTLDVYGAGVLSAFVAEARVLGLAVLAAPTFLSGSSGPALSATVAALKASDARVIVLAALHTDVAPLLEAAAAGGLVGDDFAWLLSDSITADSSLRGKSAAALDALRGAVGMRAFGGGPRTPEYAQLIAKWASLDPAKYTGAGVPFLTYYAPFAYDAVWAYARALDAMARDGVDFSRYNFTGAQGTRNSLGPALFRYLARVSFAGATGPVAFTPEGDRVGVYEVVNLRGSPSGAAWSVVGLYDGSAFEPPSPPALWRSGSASPPPDSASRCDAGFAPDPIHGCLPCAPGSYAPPASDACLPCPAGFYSVEPAAGVCSPCPAGWFQDRPGQSLCMECDVESYSQYPNATNCNRCPRDSATNRLRATTASECRCREGHFAPRPFTGAPGEACADCPPGAACSGPDPPVALENYFLIPWSVEAGGRPVFERCRTDGACVGGKDSACGAGYSGLVCGQCAQGFGQSKPFGCQQCVPRGGLLTILGLGIAGILAVLVFFTLSAVHSGLQLRSRHSVMLKILLSYVQVTAFGQAFELGWPDVLMRFLNVASTAASPVSMIVSLDCLAPADGGFGFYRQFVIYLCIPFIALAYAAAAYLVAALWRLRSVRRSGAAGARGGKEAPEGADAVPMRGAAGAPSSVGPGASQGEIALVDLGSPSDAASTAGTATPRPSALALSAPRAGRPGGLAPLNAKPDGGLASLVPAPWEVLAEERPAARAEATLSSLASELEPAAAPDADAGAAPEAGASLGLGTLAAPEARAYRPTPADYGIAALIVCMYTVHPAVSQMVLHAFNCVEIGGRRFLRLDVAVECGSPAYQQYTISLGVPAIVVYLWVVPLVPFLLLFLQRRRLDRGHLRVRYAFLCRGFKRRYVWFEAFNLVKKQLVIFIAVFLSQKIMVQGLLALGLLVAATAPLAEARPCEHRLLNLLDVVTFTVLGGLFFGTRSLEEGEASLLSALLIVANCGFLVLWLWHFTREVLQYARRQRHVGRAIAAVRAAAAQASASIRSLRSMRSPPPSSALPSGSRLFGGSGVWPAPPAPPDDPASEAAAAGAAAAIERAAPLLEPVLDAGPLSSSGAEAQASGRGAAEEAGTPRGDVVPWSSMAAPASAVVSSARRRPSAHEIDAQEL
eukprot:tig00021569_g22335.t1